MDTQVTSNYETPWMSRNQTDSIVFRVKACEEATIALSPTLYDTDQAFEVVIGASKNTLCLLRERVGGATIRLENTPGVLSCTMFRSFWIRWSPREIEFGEGYKVGIRRLMQLLPTRTPMVSYIGFATATVQGRWEISSIIGIY